jgi:site-specific DNA-methyltransferase (adenine-specific)
MEAAEINRWQAIKLPLAGYHDGAGIGGEDYAAFLAWIWTEGGFDNSWTGVRIYQSSVNPDHVVEIDRLTQKFAPDFKKYERVRTYKGREYTEYTWFFSGEPALSVREILPGKHPTYDLLWRMTLDEKRAFLSAAMDGDGSVGQKQFYQKDGVDREWFQVLAHMIGWQGRDNAKKRCVSLHDNRTTELQSRHLHATHLKDYDGEVWCVRVETGAFVARRNGRVFITGNSGFPKSLNVKKAVLKAGVDSEAASQFDGLGTALKPSWEPILVFRKPLSEATVAQNVLKHGTGGLNIDATRIGHTTRTNSSSPGKARNTMVKGMVGGVETEVHNHGRWPANTLMIHSTECEVVGSKRVKAPVINRFDDGMKPFGDGAGHSYTSEPQGDADGMEEIPVYECVEGCPVKALDKQSGFRAPGWFSGECQKGMGYHGAVTTADGSKPSSVVGEGGGASRYFGQFEPEAPFFYTAKVSKQEREGWMKGAKNPHPTMKSLSLMEWLVKLVTPRGGTTLDPYCGTGTTCVAAIQAGCQYVGIEKDPDFHALAEARLKALRTKSGDKAFDDDLADISSRLEELVPEE